MKTINSLRKSRLGLPDIKLRAATLQLSPCLPEHRPTLCQLSRWGQGATFSPAPHVSWVGFSTWIQGWAWSPATALHSSSLATFVMKKSERTAIPLLLLGEICVFCNWERVDVAGLEVFSNGCLNRFLALRIAFCSQFGLKRFHSLKMIGQSVICFLYRHNCFLLSLCLRDIIMERQRTWASLQLQIDNVETQSWPFQMISI